MDMKWLFLFSGMLLLITAISCKEADDNNAKDGVSNLYFDCVITADESDPEVTCKIQYKTGGYGGTAVSIQKPGRVELDGEELAPDSSRFSGVYYESRKALAGFSGRHVIQLVTGDNKPYREEFEFRPFKLEEDLPTVINREGLNLKLVDLPAGTRSLRVVMTDTSFGTSWINKKVKLVDGSLPITSAMLARLKNGPVGLEIYYEEEIKAKQAAPKGGRIAITYSLKRELELTD
jgi:hypothetical protein